MTKETSRVYLGGIGGVGKTTVGKEFAQKYGYLHFSGSEVMRELCGVSTREELSDVDPFKKEQIERTLYCDFVRSHPKVVVDGHCQLLPAQIDCFDHFFLIDCPADIVETRRDERGRRSTNVKQIELRREEYRDRVKNIEHTGSVNFVVVDNSGSSAETVEAIARAIKC